MMVHSVWQAWRFGCKCGCDVRGRRFSRRRDLRNRSATNAFAATTATRSAREPEVWPHEAQPKAGRASPISPHPLRAIEGATAFPAHLEMGSREILRRNRLRPPHQRRPSCIGQLIDAASGAHEPAIDIVQQYLGCIGDGGPQVSRRSRTIPEQGGTGERLSCGSRNA